MSSALQRALDRGLQIGVYTEQMFTTSNDEDNRAAVRAVPRSRLNLVGLAVHGPRGAVDKALKNVRPRMTRTDSTITASMRPRSMSRRRSA